MSRQTSISRARAASLLWRLLISVSLCAAQALAQKAGRAPRTAAGQDDEVATIKSQLVNKVGAKKEKLSVPGTGAEFSASRVVLSRHVERVRALGVAGLAEDIFRDGDVQIRPSPSRDFTGADNLNIFFKLYNTAVDPATGKPSARVTFILSKDGKAVTMPLGYDLPDAAQGSVPHITFARSVPLAGLQPGRYEASVESRDMFTLKLVKQKAPFVIR